MVDQEKIHIQCLSDNPKNRIEALWQLRNEFSQLPDKDEAWNDLHILINDEDRSVRYRATSTLRYVFSYVLDKQRAWNDLHRLINDEFWDVRSVAAYTLSYVFSQVPDKTEAWNDLHELINDEDRSIRYNAAPAFRFVFSQIPDKQKVWKDFLRLTYDEDVSVRSGAGFALGFEFSAMPDKQEAWNVLHRLTNDVDWDVRSAAAFSLGSVFFQLLDKKQAWNDLHRLTNEKNSSVRYRAATAVGSAFSQVPDKQQALNDLYRLINDEERLVRTYACYSLGRVFIFKASQAETEEDYKKELEKAIEYFEKTAQEAQWGNPSQFCLPFYRSFHTIIFKKQEAKEEVNKYLEEAKAAIKDSESKKQLYEAVENLSQALKEVQNLENLDLQGMKGELNFYRKYCDHAAELMINSEETAPFAIAVMRKGLPILDEYLREIVEDIQRKTELISKNTKGTHFEQLSDELKQSSLFLLQVRDLIGFRKQVNIMENTLKAICSKFPEGQKGEACDLLKIMYAEQSIEDKIPLMNNILSKFSYQLDIVNCLDRVDAKLDKLDCISFDIFKLKLNAGNVISSLDNIKTELGKLNGTVSLNTFSVDKLNFTQIDKLNNLNNDISERLDEIKTLICSLPSNEEIREILDKLNKLKQTDLDTLLQRSSGITSLISFFVMFAQVYQQYNC